MRKPRQSLFTILFTVGLLAFFGAFLVYPVVYVFDNAFMVGVRVDGIEALTGRGVGLHKAFSLEYFRLMLVSGIERECVINSAALGIITVLGTSLLAFPLAFLSVRRRFFGKGLMTGLVLVPMIMPPFVGAIGVKRLLAREGSVNLLLMRLAPLWDRAVLLMEQTFVFPEFAWPVASPGFARPFEGIDFVGQGGFWAVAAMQILHLYPIMYLNVVAALANVDPSLEDAARNLGGRGLGLFRRITLPLLLPGYFAGAILVFVWAFTDLGSALIFGYPRVVAVRIFDRLSNISENPMGYANVVVLMVVASAAFLLGKLAAAGRSYAMITKGAVGSQEKTLRPWATVFALAAVIGVALVALIPHLGVFLTSVEGKWSGTILPSQYTLKWYGEVVTNSVTGPSIRNSLFLSLSSTLVDVLLGVGLAVLIVRRRAPGSALLDTLAMAPLALPGLVLAFGYLKCYSGTPGLDPRVNPVPLLIIAYAVRRLPFMLRSVVAGFQQTSVSLEEASRNLGATPGQTLARITIPLIIANIVAGAILCFSFAMLEVSDSLILAAKPRFYPITKAIYMVSRQPAVGPSIAGAMGMLAMGMLVVCLLAAGAFMGKRLGEIFRA